MTASTWRVASHAGIRHSVGSAGRPRPPRRTPLGRALLVELVDRDANGLARRDLLAENLGVVLDQHGELVVSAAVEADAEMRADGFLCSHGHIVPQP